MIGCWICRIGGGGGPLRAGYLNGSSPAGRDPVTVFPPEKHVDSFRTFWRNLWKPGEDYSGFEGQLQDGVRHGNGGLIFLGIAAALCLFLKEKSDEKEKPGRNG